MWVYELCRPFSLHLAHQSQKGDILCFLIQ
jgi:hypothetical protein